MRLPWRKIGTIGKFALKYAAPFVPGGAIAATVLQAVETVEATRQDIKGADKKAAALAMVGMGVAGAEAITGRDVVNDQAVVSLSSQLIDLYVALRNAEAQVRQLIGEITRIKGAIDEAVKTAKAVPK